MDIMTTIAPLHLGAMHAHEQLLTLLLAFGPFLLLGIVIVVRRRQDAQQDAQNEDAQNEDAQRER